MWTKLRDEAGSQLANTEEHIHLWEGPSSLFQDCNFYLPWPIHHFINDLVGWGHISCLFLNPVMKQSLEAIVSVWDVQIRIQKAPKRFKMWVISVKLRKRLPKYLTLSYLALFRTWDLNWRGNSPALFCTSRTQVDGSSKYVYSVCSRKWVKWTWNQQSMFNREEKTLQGYDWICWYLKISRRGRIIKLKGQYKTQWMWTGRQ